MHTINRMLALALRLQDIHGHSLLAYGPVPLPTSSKQAPVCRRPSVCSQSCTLFPFRSDQDGASRSRDTRQLCLGASSHGRCLPSNSLCLAHQSPQHTVHLESESSRPKPSAFLLTCQSVHLLPFLLHHYMCTGWGRGLVVSAQLAGETLSLIPNATKTDRHTHTYIHTSSD